MVVLDTNNLNNIELDDINIDFCMLEEQAKQKQNKHAILSKKDSQNKYAMEAEPQPLFDCLYCVGIHEHLIL